MSLSDQTLRTLQQLMAQDKALLARVQASDDATQIATLIAEAAEQNGFAVNTAELAAHFAEASRISADHALSDSQLDAAAGGGIRRDDMILISIFTFGVGCAVISIKQAAGAPGGFGDQKFC